MRAHMFDSECVLLMEHIPQSLRRHGEARGGESNIEKKMVQVRGFAADSWQWIPVYIYSCSGSSSFRNLTGLFFQSSFRAIAFIL